MGEAGETARGPLTRGTVFRTWWPLAGSWLLMGLELPVVAAFMARLPEAERSLAAYGGIVFPLALIIEAPVIMFLAASTALSKDEASYRLMRRVVHGTGLVLTVLHTLVAFTPLFDVVVGGWMGAPEEIHEAGRMGLRIFLPWTWSIAYRRFQQGVLIRFGQSKYVIRGTAVRLGANLVVLTVGMLLGNLPGIVVGASAVAVGVTAEAIAVGRWVRPVRRDRLARAPRVEPPLTLGRFTRFYVPLALTSAITLIGQPISAAAVSRMPLAVESLAVIPVIHGLTFLLRALGFSFNEVVVALLDERDAYPVLRRFAVGLALSVSGFLAVLAFTPLGAFYLRQVASLPEGLVRLGIPAFAIVVAAPALAVALHFFQGVLVHAHRTVPITEAVLVNFATYVGLLVIGVAYGGFTGLYVALGAHTTANLTQALWLGFRSRNYRRSLLVEAPA